MQKIRAIINLKTIRDNAEVFKRNVKTKLCAVVKANAYGHGAEEVAYALSGVADCFAVAIVEEGFAIRAAACGKDILVLTPPVSEQQAFYIVGGGLIGSVSDMRTAKIFVAACKTCGLRARVHLQVNTGMNRYGASLSALDRICRFLRDEPCIQVTGVYSHLYAPSRADEQRREFVKAERICRRYFPNVCAHLSATYGCCLGQDYAFDMVRVGIGLYGYLPDGIAADTKAFPVKKAMKIYAQAMRSRTYHGGGAGYGERSELTLGEQFSLLRVGYADGFLRLRDNGTIGENVNALCMDACLQKGRKRRGDWVCVLSDADEVAKKTGTIPYEVLCAATRRAEFAYVYE